jgi:hypothetical protein
MQAYTYSIVLVDQHNGVVDENFVGKILRDGYSCFTEAFTYIMYY